MTNAKLHLFRTFSYLIEDIENGRIYAEHRILRAMSRKNFPH